MQISQEPMSFKYQVSYQNQRMIKMIQMCSYFLNNPVWKGLTLKPM